MEANGTASTGCNMQCYNRLAGKNRQKVEAGVIFIKFLCNYTLDCGLKKNAAIENQSLTVKCEVNFEKHFIFRLINAAKQSSFHLHLLPVDDIHSTAGEVQSYYTATTYCQREKSSPKITLRIINTPAARYDSGLRSVRSV